jgi:hypothetical protein
MELEKPNSLLCGKNPPEHLYHYTSIHGLKGILTERSVWASQIHFLNDVQEFKYSLSILEKVLDELLKELAREPKDFLFYSFMRGLLLASYLEKSPICVFSLSEKGDLLSQWRGYCPPGGGYSIGFRSDLLIQSLKTHDLCIKPCIYNETEQEATVKRAVTETRETLLTSVSLKSVSASSREYQKAVNDCVVQFFIDFSRIASTVKHPSFHEECEWRIISKLVENKYMSFRARKSILIPYISISLEDIEPFPIDEIFIGPAPEQPLTESSLRQFVLRNNLNISIKTSEIPYREL